MKKFLSAVMLSVMLSSNVFAASETELFPKETEFYASFDLGELKDDFKDLLVRLAESEGEDIESYLESKFAVALKDMVALDYGMPSYLSFEGVKADFEKLLEEDGELMKKTRDGKEYYYVSPEFGDEVYGFYRDGIGIIAYREEDLFKVMDGGESLASDSDFKAAMGKLGEGALMNLYFADGALAMLDPELERMYGDIGYLAASLDQISGGFRIKTVSELKSDRKPSEVRDLHRLLPGGEAIMAVDSLNSYDEDSSVYSELFKELDAGLGFNFDFEEVVKGAKEYAILAQNGKGILPEVTVMIQMRGGEDKVEIIADNLISELEAVAGFAGLKVEVDEQALNSQDNALKVIKLQSLEPFEDLGLLELQLTVGMTDNDVFLLSTNPRIFSEYGEGNSLVREDDFYFSFDELGEALEKFASLTGEEGFGAAKELLSPFGEMTGRTDLSSYPIVVETLDIDFDLAQAERVYTSENIERLMEDFYEVPYPDYNEAGTWYSESSDYLLLTGVAEDFEAGEQIGRGEAVEWLVRGLQQAGEAYPIDGGKDPFKDVAYWQEEIATAKALGFVTGYSDGTFRPKSEINRAEFAALLGRVARKYGLSGDSKLMNFPDVKAGAWYYEDVKLAYELGWMKGDDAGTFRPAGLLTQAEAAVVVKRVLDEMWN